MSRPLGVTILAILALIGGIFGLVGGAGAVFGGGIAAAAGFVQISGLVTVMGLAVVALAVVSLALAYGFWTLKPWAWQLGIVLEVVNVAVSVLQVIFGGAGFASILGTLVVAGIILWYLNTPDVRKAFGAPATGFPLIGGGK